MFCPPEEEWNKDDGTPAIKGRYQIFLCDRLSSNALHYAVFYRKPVAGAQSTSTPPIPSTPPSLPSLFAFRPLSSSYTLLTPLHPPTPFSLPKSWNGC
jgi:hypothetical protein